LDERIQVAGSSGWLTTVANMKNGHCPCFNFPGLEEHFDFSDIFACVAPRAGVRVERTGTGTQRFRWRSGGALAKSVAYRVFNAESIDADRPSGPHVFAAETFPCCGRLGENAGRPGCGGRGLDALRRPGSPDGTPYHWLVERKSRRVPSAAGDAAIELGPNGCTPAELVSGKSVP
jgi:hypothetical protein